MNSTFRFYIKKAFCHSMVMSSSSAREARILKKMIDRSLTKVKSGFQAPKVLKKLSLTSAYENEGPNKKIIALNKIYMEQIPEMVYDGSFGSYFNDLKIQLTKVQLSKDFNFLNIYYITKSTDIPEHIINEVLIRLAKELRIRIGDLKFLKKVPYVRFINDVRWENEFKLENIFKVIDLGKDSVPTHLKKVITSNTISKPGDLPIMRQDVLGIDVAKIKQRISADIFRFKATNSVKSDESAEEHEYPTKLIKFSRKEFFKFYKRRRIEELKRIKREHQTLFMNENEDEEEDEYENEYEIDYEVEYEDENEDEDEDEYDNDENENDNYKNEV